MSVTRAGVHQPPHPPPRATSRSSSRTRLASAESELADLTARALSLFYDAAVAQERLRSEVVRLVLLGVLATAVASVGLCLATLVLVART